MTWFINIIHRIIFAIWIQVIWINATVCTHNLRYIRTDEPLHLCIIVSTLQVVQSGFGVIVVWLISIRIDCAYCTCKCSRCWYCITPCVVFIGYNNGARAIIYIINIPPIIYTIVIIRARCAVVIETYFYIQYFNILFTYIIPDSSNFVNMSFTVF